MIVHANKLRNSVVEAEQKQESIRLSQQMAEQIFAHPWASVSPNFCPNLCPIFRRNPKVEQFSF